jgi:hypothetical protein
VAAERAAGGGRGWRIADAVMGLLFAFGAAVQVNDPDPLAWIAIYAAAALLSFRWLARRVRWWAPALVALAALAWAATLAPRVLGRVPFGDMFGAFEMANAGIEESREMYGLLIIAAWMAVVAFRGKREAGSGKR